MKIEGFPYSISNWNQIPCTEHPGEKGMALWRTIELGNVRVRMVQYSPDYLADHWCDRGHIVLVLAGEIATELKDGRSFLLSAGQSYQVADGKEPHRSQSRTGAKLFIVD